MKKILTLATAVLLITGSAFAHDGKKCGKGKDCCKKEMKKDAKSAAAKDVKQSAPVKKA